MYTTVTLNCWNTMYWDVRRPILVDFVKQFKPSVLCCQEVRPAVIEAIQEGASGSYQYVDPSRDSFEGWQQEGNIFWDPSVFSYIECGVIDAGMCEPLRRLFFVKLRAIDNGKEVIISNIHLTWQGQKYRTDNADPRKEQIQKVIDKALRPWSEMGIPSLFMGDLNCPFFPKKLIKDQVPVFLDCFSALQLRIPTTHPARPSDEDEEQYPDQTYDWIFVDSQRVKPLMATVPHKTFHGSWRNCSDHFPVWLLWKFC